MKKSSKIPYNKLQELTGKKIQDLTYSICSDCGIKIERKEQRKEYKYLCKKCGENLIETEKSDIKVCPKCNFPMVLG